MPPGRVPGSKNRPPLREGTRRLMTQAAQVVDACRWLEEEQRRIESALAIADAIKNAVATCKASAKRKAGDDDRDPTPPAADAKPGRKPRKKVAPWSRTADAPEAVADAA